MARDLDEADNINGDGEDEVAVFITGEFGTLTLGDTDGAYDRVLTENYGNPGSIDDSETGHAGYNGASGLDGDYDGQILRYDYSFDAISVAASIELDDSSDEFIWAIGFGYAFDFAGGTAEVALAYQTDTGTDAELVGLTAGVELDSGLEAGVFFHEGDSNNGDRACPFPISKPDLMLPWPKAGVRPVR